MSHTSQPIKIRHIPLPAQTTPSPLAFVPPVILIVVAAATILALAVFEIWYARRIYPGVRVWGLELGGMKPEEAVLALEAHWPYSSQPVITLRDGERTFNVRPRELGIQLDAAAIAQSAYRLGHGGSPRENLAAQARLLWSGAQLGPIIRMDPNVTRAYLEKLAAALNTQPRDASLHLDGMDIAVTPSIAGRALNIDAVIAQLAEASRSVSPVEIALEFQPVLPAVADVAQAKAHLEAIIGSPMTIVATPPVTSSIGPLQISREELASMAIIRRVDAQHIDVTLDEARLRALLTPLALKIEQPAINGRFVFDDELRELRVISPSQPGIALNIPATAARINQQAVTDNRQVATVITYTQATYHDRITAKELGITELVAEGVTYFLGSSASRIKNIKTAASRFHGIIIAPGETFSFVKYLGEVSLDQGYDKALIIYQDRTIEGVGGGVCQVSTTVYQAAFFAGFPIVERWPHAYRVGWYERGFGPGLDATVFAPSVDFKFTNDTPYHLLIESYVYEKTGMLVFRFYSTKDGRKVQVTKPTITRIVPHGPDRYEEDPKLKPGQKEQVDWAVDGADVTVKRIIERGGQAITETVFTRYQPWQNVFRVAPGEAPKPEPTPNP